MRFYAAHYGEIKADAKFRIFIFDIEADYSALSRAAVLRRAYV